MKKTSLLLVFGLALGLASVTAPKAHAGVVIGVTIGSPVYVHPAHSRYGAPYYVASRPFVAFAPAPIYRRVYVAPAPVYRDRWYAQRYVERRDFDRRDYDRCRR
jgi:hypothetical protein